MRCMRGRVISLEAKAFRIILKQKDGIERLKEEAMTRKASIRI